MKFMFGLQHPLTCNPSTTLSNPCNKERGEYVVKEVFLRLPSCVFLDTSFIIVSVCIQYIYVCNMGMLIGPRAQISQNIIEKIQPRIMVATFNGNPSATIISSHSPTNVSEETDLIAFFDGLSSLVCGIPKHNILVINRDMCSRKKEFQIII